MYFSWPFPNTASRSNDSRKSGRFVCAWNDSAANAHLGRLPRSPTTANRGLKTLHPLPNSGKSPVKSTKPSQNGDHRRTIHRRVSEATSSSGHWRTCGHCARFQPAHQGRRCLAGTLGFFIRVGGCVGTSLLSIYRNDHSHPSRLAAGRWP